MRPSSPDSHATQPLASAPFLPRKVAANTGYLALSNALQYSLTFITGMLIARLLGATAIGIYGLASAVGQIANRVAGLGMPAILIRLFSRDHPACSRRFASAMAFRLWSGFVTVLAVEGFALAVGYDIEVQAALCLYMVGQWIAGLRETASSVYHGRQSMARPAVASAIFRIVAFLFGVTFLLVGLGVLWMIAALAVGQTVAAVYLALGPEPEARRLPAAFDKQELLAVLRESLPIGIATIFAAINIRVDAVVLSLYVDESELGHYNAAAAIILGLALFPNSFLPALYPALSRRFAQSKRAASSLFWRCQLLNGALGLVLAATISVSAAWLMPTLYGDGFAAAGPVLGILSWAIFFVYLSHANNTYFLAVDRQNLYLFTAVLGGAVNLVANLTLIPRFGAEGAAFATVLSEAMLLAMTSILALRLGRRPAAVR